MSISRNMVDNFRSAGFASHLGNGMNSGGTGNLGDNMTSFNRGDYLFDNGDINAMFSGVFGARCFNGLGFEFGKSNNMRSSIAKMVEVLRICFGFRFSFGRTLDNDRTACFADHLFAPMKIRYN